MSKKSHIFPQRNYYNNNNRVKETKEVKKIKKIKRIKEIKEIKKRYYIIYIKLNNRFIQVIVNFLINLIIILIAR